MSDLSYSLWAINSCNPGLHTLIGKCRARNVRELIDGFQGIIAPGTYINGANETLMRYIRINSVVHCVYDPNKGMIDERGDVSHYPVILNCMVEIMTLRSFQARKFDGLKVRKIPVRIGIALSQEYYFSPHEALGVYPYCDED